MPVLQHCCCCATLAVGGVIIGWVNLIFALLQIIVTAFSISNFEKIKDQMGDLDKESRETIELILSFGTIAQIIILIVKVIGFIVAIMLILGASKRNRFHILPHLIFEAVYIFFILILWIVFLIGVFSAPGLIAPFVMLTLFAAFNLYLWLCVLSLYQEIRDDETRQPAGSYLMSPPGQNQQMQFQQKPPSYAVQQNLL